MQVTHSARHARHVLIGSLKAAAWAAAIAAFGTQSAQAVVVVPANADAEIRESQPEFTRGFGVPAGSGQAAELQLSQINSNRNLAIVRFSLAGMTSADLGGYAALNMYFRAGTNFGTADGASVRLYALNPTHPLNATWNEQEVMYRDAGSHQLVNPQIGSGQSLQSPSVINQSAGFPTPPVSGSAGYGANPTHSRRAPGIRYEDAPFSAQIEAENQARFLYNQANGTTLPYINQPGYGVRATTTLAVADAVSVGDGNPATTGDGYTDIYSDIPETNRPWDSGPTDSYVDDLDGYTLIGYSRMIGNSAAGFFVDFGSTIGFDNTPASHESMIQANLLSFLGTQLDLGQTEFTFLVGRGLATLDFDGDTLIDDPVHGGAVHFASKDLIPAGGFAGDFAPRLIVAPEPGSMMLLGLAGAAGLLRRRRN